MDIDEKNADGFYGVVTVGRRGLMVLPAEARRAFGLAAGQKLFVHAVLGSHAFVIIRERSFRDKKPDEIR